ncbi:hypothetical protein BDP27DRAFT_1416980 [Rhodocollybia butyracea]|uniref:Uncharacterized protein n=1 Tax=Rhodocollybia butyracea TaxID=206335 RepID=A0A9P5PVY6_9AGAR|nr:hypothetical protein BDP27DRAFT_1416980 [Rhodocollybia butyracea]
MSVTIQKRFMSEHELVRRGPTSNTTCVSGFSWANDASNNSPCLVAAAVVGACLNADYNVPPLMASNHYNVPGDPGQPADVCTCSWAAYNLFSACTACQGLTASLLPWAGYHTNCNGSLLSNTTYYPSDVVTLDNTSIPFYATTNPVLWQNAIFSVSQAQNISEQGHPDVYGAPITTSTPSEHKSNAGAIGGGVAGGVVVLIGAVVAWWILRKRGYTWRKRNGKPQEIDAAVYNQGHTRSVSDLTKSNVGDSSFGNTGYGSPMSMQPLHMAGFSPSPFASTSSHMASVSSVGAFSTPPSQPGYRGGSPPSAYNGDASTIISRYSSPSPSMQLVNRSQSPDSHLNVNPAFGNEISVQPFMLPPTSTSPPPPSAGMTKSRAAVYDSPPTRRDSQESLVRHDHDDTPSPPRRVNPPAYHEVAFSDSQDVATQRRESHGTSHVGHSPLREKQVSQTSQGSQDSSIWTAPVSNAHGGPELAAIDAYVGQMASSRARPGGAGGADAVPMLHTTALAPGQAGPSMTRRLTVNTTVDDGDTSVLDGHRGGEGGQDSPAIA